MEPASTVAWYPGHEGRVIHQTFVGNITLDELASSSQEIIGLIRQGTAPVHLLLDVRRLAKFPLSANQLNKALAHVREPGLGWALLVGSSSIMGTFAGIIAQIARINLRSFATLDEALAFVAEQDPSFANR